jgi:DNA invertase Pin-like site-specific DNA recombinase
MKTNVCIYARVSSTQQDYQRQLVQLTEYCQTHNMNLVKTFEEKLSGFQRVRPALTELMEFVGNKANDIDTILIDELSRFGRSIQIVSTIEKLNAIGVNVFAKKEGLNSLMPDRSENSTAMLIITISAGIAKNEAYTMKYRQMSGRINSVKNGFHWGGLKLPYGYDKDLKTKRLYVNDIEANVVRQIFTDFANGQSYYTIGKNLIYNEVPTKLGGKWVISLIFRMLRNSIYIGQVMYKGEMYNNSDLQIVTNELWDMVQVRLTTLKRPANAVKHSYKLESSKIKCGVCGQSYTPVTRSNYSFYMCFGKLKIGHTCNNHNIMVNKLVDSIEHVITYNYKPTLIDSIDNIIVNSDLKNCENEIEVQEKNVKSLNKNESQLIDLMLDNAKITKKIFDEKLNAINENREKSEKRLTALKSKLIELQQIKANANNLPKLIAEIDSKGMNKELLNKILNKVTIAPKENKTVLVSLFIGSGRFEYHLNNSYVQGSPVLGTMYYNNNESSPEDLYYENIEEQENKEEFNFMKQLFS